VETEEREQVFRTALKLEYEGTAYAGFQWQPDQRTLQSALEEAVLKLYGRPIRIIGSGRTDSGVHARGQVLHYDAPKKLPVRNVQLALNSYLPRDIRVLSAAYPEPSFHARFDAVQRHYSYQILLRPTALERSFAWTLFDLRNSGILLELAPVFRGEHDFSSFCSVHTEAEHKMCIVSQSRWDLDGEHLTYRISANRFLHSMVRMIVGTMIQLARKGKNSSDLQSLLGAKQKDPLIFTAPACGLFLDRVEYAADIFSNKD